MMHIPLHPLPLQLLHLLEATSPGAFQGAMPTFSQAEPAGFPDPAGEGGCG